MTDAHKNFAVSTVATAPSPAASGTSVTVATGEGARFPAAPFNATICPVGVIPTPANAEVVRVTAIAGDVLTITRTQETSSARTVVVGDLIFASITAKTLTDVEFNPSYAVICDQKTANSTSGNFASGAYRTRDLNTEQFDPDGIVSISSNQFTLGAGTYLIRASAPAFNVNRHKARIQNITDSTTPIYGTSEDTEVNANTVSLVVGGFTIAGTKTFELQHRCNTTGNIRGFGAEANLGDPEIYAVVEINKIAA